MNPQTKELIESVESVLGFVWGEEIEARRERQDLLPIIPQRVRGLAAQRVFMRLERAVIAFKALDEIASRFEAMTE